MTNYIIKMYLSKVEAACFVNLIDLFPSCMQPEVI